MTRGRRSAERRPRILLLEVTPKCGGQGSGSTCSSAYMFRKVLKLRGPLHNPCFCSLCVDIKAEFIKSVKDETGDFDISCCRHFFELVLFGARLAVSLHAVEDVHRLKWGSRNCFGRV